MYKVTLSIVVVALLLLPGANPALRSSDQLSPTAHQPLARTATELWLVPAAEDLSLRALAPYKSLIDGATAFGAGDYRGALPLVSQASLASTDLRDYAAYYTAASQLRLSRLADARALFHALRERKPPGYLSVSSAIGEAEAAEALGDYKAAIAIYHDLVESKTTINEDVLLRLARASFAANERKQAAEAYLRVYYEFPLTEAAIAAETQLETLRDHYTRVSYKADLGRAQMFYGARRYPEARAAFASLQGEVSGDDRELVDLRIAECDFFLKRYPAARDELHPYLDNASRKAEARFFALSTLRELDRDDEFVAATRALVDEFPDSSWSEEALNNLGTYYILTNEDDLAAKSFRELYEKFPSGIRAERAAWKYGWYQVQNRRLSRDDQGVRKRRDGVQPLGLQAVVPLLGRSCARQGRQRSSSRRASPACADRLRELVLRAPGEREADAASRGTRRRRTRDQAGGGDCRDSVCDPDRAADSPPAGRWLVR